MSKSRRQLVEAQDELRSRLVSALGPDLPGVSGFGAGLDDDSDQLRLKVLVEDQNLVPTISRKLPGRIRGLTVQVMQRDLAVFD